VNQNTPDGGAVAEQQRIADAAWARVAPPPDVAEKVHASLFGDGEKGWRRARWLPPLPPGGVYQQTLAAPVDRWLAPGEEPPKGARVLETATAEELWAAALAFEGRSVADPHEGAPEFVRKDHAGNTHLNFEVLDEVARGEVAGRVVARLPELTGLGDVSGLGEEVSALVAAGDFLGLAKLRVVRHVLPSPIDGSPTLHHTVSRWPEALPSTAKVRTVAQLIGDVERRHEVTVRYGEAYAREVHDGIAGHGGSWL
jgi:hypothetical protein